MREHGADSAGGRVREAPSLHAAMRLVNALLLATPTAAVAEGLRLSALAAASAAVRPAPYIILDP